MRLQAGRRGDLGLMKALKAIVWEKGKLSLLNQTLLPVKNQTVTCKTYEDVAEAIKTMVVRGAPAIGVTAAYGLVLAAQSCPDKERETMNTLLQRAKSDLMQTRPTAVNLFWALNRMERIWLDNPESPVVEIKKMLEDEAVAIDEEDLARNKSIGRFGNELIPAKANILTHCNAGALATAGYGTALGVIRAAYADNKKIHVYVDETRPLMQGARLTAWELLEDNIPVTLIIDSTAGYLMGQQKIDLVVVGADRIAVNGDVANKIGTYSVAVLANYHGIPFYVAAPMSTFDLSMATGKGIPIEERQHDEIRKISGVSVAPEKVNVYNPAFDVTPASLITAIITDRGILKPPYKECISALARLNYTEYKGGTG